MSAGETESRGELEDSRADAGFRFLCGLAEGVIETRLGVVVRSDEAAPHLLGVSGGVHGLLGRSLSELLHAPGAKIIEGSPERWVTFGTRDSRHGGVVALRTWPLSDVSALHVVSGDEGRAGGALDRARSDFVAVRHEVTSIRDAFDSAVEWQQRLLSLVSHELRTPITVIRGYARLLLSESVGPLLEEQRRFLEESVKSCERLDAFVEELVELSTSSSEADPILPPEPSLEVVLRGVVDYLRPLLEERDAQVELAIAPDVDRVRCEPERIEQLVANLVGNALKHVGTGVKVEIQASARFERGARMVETTVSDDGPGVPLAFQPVLFEAGSQSAVESGGQGLGLAICKSIVEARGGRIEYRLGRGGGSCFAFLLPAAASGDGSVSFRHESQEG